MADGFFLGGFARGSARSRRGGQVDRELGLRERALGLDMRSQELEAQRDLIERTDVAIANTLKQIGEVVKAGREANRSDQQILGAIQPLAESAATLQAGIGQDPAQIEAQVRALLSTPSAVELAGAQGRGEAAAAVVQANALTGAGVSVETAREAAGIAGPGLKTTTVNSRDAQGDLTTEIITTDSQGDIVNRERVGGGPTVQFQPPTTPGKTAIEKLQNAEIATRTVISDIDRLKQQLTDENTLTSLVASGTQAINTISGNLKQAAQLFGFDDTSLFTPDKYDFAAFGEEAAASGAFQSNVLKLAYSLARAEDPGGRLSDRDVQVQIDRLAAGSGDKAVISSILDEVAEASKRAFRARFDVINRFSGGNLGEFPPELESSDARQQQIEFKPPQGFDFVRMENGRPVIRRQTDGQEFIGPAQ